MEKQKIKPCPFCGGEVNIYYSSATKAFYAVHIDKQGASKDCILLTPMILIGKYESLKQAYSAWNRRANDVCI